MSESLRHAPIPRFAISAVECDTPHSDRSNCNYQVAWAINPHMVRGGVDPRRAGVQHAAFRSALVSAGAELLPLPFVHGAFDSVFMKDNALLGVLSDRQLALLGVPKFPERRQEQLARESALEEAGFEVLRSHCALEGGDVVVQPGRRGALFGYGYRSSRRVVSLLEAFLGGPVIPLELRDPSLYHLDTALAALEDGALLLCEEAFTRESLASLRRQYQAGPLLPVPRAEALRFGVNFVQVEKTVILGGASPVVEAMLRLRGLSPIVSPLSEFQLAGGSAACLVSRVHPLDAVTTRETTEIRSTSAYAGRSSSSPNTSGSSSSYW